VFFQKKGQTLPGDEILFRDYAKGFFEWDGDYAKSKRALGHRISPEHCRTLTSQLENHIIPRLGGFRLTEIKKATLRDFRNGLAESGKSGNLIIRLLQSVNSILEKACEDELIEAVPTTKKPAYEYKKRGILTPGEMREIFAVPWDSPAGHGFPTRKETAGFLGNLLMATTGCRVGEIQALQVKDVDVKTGIISISKTWQKSPGKVKEGTKTGKARRVIISQSVIRVVKAWLADGHPDASPESFLFPGYKKKDKPAEQRYFEKTLKRALAKIGIDEAERKKRNITLHSWRHFLNTYLLDSGLNAATVKSITGHSTDVMQNHYYHPAENLAPVQIIQEKLLSGGD